MTPRGKIYGTIVGFSFSMGMTSCSKIPEQDLSDQQPQIGDTDTNSNDSATVNDQKNWTFETKKPGENPEVFATGLAIPPAETTNAMIQDSPALNLTAVPLPSSFDWRAYAISPIRDQGSCGACWAFSATSASQDVISLFMRDSPLLSNQYPIDCNKMGSTCDGGFYTDTLQIFQTDGVVYESDYPYSAKKNLCNNIVTKRDKITSFAFIDKNAVNQNPIIYDDIVALKNAIYQNGPVMTSMNATTQFMSYASGIYNACEAPLTSSTQLNHAVSLVGWDDAGQYWIARNSWGTSWGEKGFFRMKWNCNGLGAGSVSIVVPKLKTPQPLPPPPPPPAPAKTTLLPSEVLSASGQLAVKGKGSNCTFTATMQSDGNFVLKRGTVTTWQTKTAGNAGAYLTLLANAGVPPKSAGNLAVYKSDKKTVAWHAAIGGKGGTKLSLIGNGRLLVTNAAGKAIWASNAPVAGCTP